MTNLIAFCGVKQSGKSTACEVLLKLKSEYKPITLAGKIKEASSKVFNIPLQDFENGIEKEKTLLFPIILSSDNLTDFLNEYKKEFNLLNIEYNYDDHIRVHIGKPIYTKRNLLQYLGTEVLRQLDPQIHCKVVDINMKNNNSYILTDMRFPNEFDFFNKKGIKFTPIYIKNPIAESIAIQDTHPSERLVFTTCKKCGIIIENISTLENFKSKVSNLVKEL